MTRTKKIAVTFSALLVLALIASALIFAAPHLGQLVSTGNGLTRVSAPIQAVAPGNSGVLLADCPGCPPDGPH
jgi:hypothetical protein